MAADGTDGVPSSYRRPSGAKASSSTAKSNWLALLNQPVVVGRSASYSAGRTQANAVPEPPNSHFSAPET